MATNGRQPSRGGHRVVLSVTVTEEADRHATSLAKTLRISKSRAVEYAILRFDGSADDLKAIRIAELRAELATLEQGRGK